MANCAALSVLEGWVILIALSAFLPCSRLPAVNGDDIISTFLRSCAFIGYKRFEPPVDEVGKPFGFVDSNRVGGTFLSPAITLLAGGFEAGFFAYIYDG